MCEISVNIRSKRLVFIAEIFKIGPVGNSPPTVEALPELEGLYYTLFSGRFLIYSSEKKGLDALFCLITHFSSNPTGLMSYVQKSTFTNY